MVLAFQSVFMTVDPEFICRPLDGRVYHNLAALFLYMKPQEVHELGAE